MREVRLIAHAAAQSNRTQRLARRQHQTLGNFDAPAQHIGVGRYTECTFERAGKVARAQAEELGELRNANPSGKVGVDMCNEPAGLPCRETSACDLSLYDGQRTRDARSEARLPVEKCNRVRDVRSCRFAVTSTGSACSFDELSRND